MWRAKRSGDENDCVKTSGRAAARHGIQCQGRRAMVPTHIYQCLSRESCLNSFLFRPDARTLGLDHVEKVVIINRCSRYVHTLRTPHEISRNQSIASIQRRHWNARSAAGALLARRTQAVVGRGTADINQIIALKHNLQLVGRHSRSGRPLVARGVAELVSVASSEVVQHCRASGSCAGLSASWPAARVAGMLTVGVLHGDDLLVVI